MSTSNAAGVSVGGLDDVRVLDRGLSEEMRASFLDYSMYSIGQRALPDARDGLKPVHRRILQAMLDEGVTPNRPHKKSATVVGTTLGRYHPHGDAAVYDAMVRMAQSFSMLVPFVDGQGNFGSVDGDPAAAYRYTEAKMTAAAYEMMLDLDQDTVDFRKNFDGRHDEPVVLPARLPNLLLNGSDGIAVGMATHIPPHNLRELSEAIRLLCADPNVDEERVLACVRGPDFPTGGVLLHNAEIDHYLRKGAGKLTLRGKGHVEYEKSSGRPVLVFTEIGYGVNKASLLGEIAGLVKEARMAREKEKEKKNAKKTKAVRYPWQDWIHAIRDESDRQGMRMVIELKRGVEPSEVMEALFVKTKLQITYGVQMLAIVKDKPRRLGLKRALEVWIRHRLEVVSRRARYEKEAAEKRVHILEGLLIAMDAIDRVVALIRAAKNQEVAARSLMKEFKLTEVQAGAILALRLASLTGLDVRALQEELATKRLRIAELEHLLSSAEARRALVWAETEKVVERFAEERRTEILDPSVAEERVARAADQTLHVQVTASGRLRAFPENSHRMTGGSDPACLEMVVQPTEPLILFTSLGRYFSVLPASLTMGGAGSSVDSLVPEWESGERVLLARSAQELQAGGFILHVQANGLVKKSEASEFASPRGGGALAVGLREGDQLLSVLHVEGTEDVLLSSAAGKAIRFSVEEIPVHGRVARGVQGMRLAGEEDRLVSACILGQEVWALTVRGLGKRISQDDFPKQGRAGQGVWVVRPERTGELVCAISPGTAGVLLLDGEGSANATLAADAFQEGKRAHVGWSVPGMEDGVAFVRALGV